MSTSQGGPMGNKMGLGGGQPGMMYPGGPGNVERGSMMPAGAPTGAYHRPPGAGYQPSAPTGQIGGMDFAQFMQSPQGLAIMQSLRGGGQPSPGPVGQPGGMRGPSPGGLLAQPGFGMRPMAPVMPPQGLPPGVSMGLRPR